MRSIIALWVVFAGLSAVFAGITAILSKCGIKNTDSTVATAIRTIVVLVSAWIMVAAAGSAPAIATLSYQTIIFLVLSGLATGASWLCYYKALQKGNVNKVVTVDKSSTVLTFILALIFFDEALTWFKGIGMLLTAVGIFLMIEKKDVRSESIEAANGGTENEKRNFGWLIYAVLSAVFASATAILGKIGIDGVESNLGTALRTSVVLVFVWIMVFATDKTNMIRNINSKELIFILLSGLATGVSWLCYYKALRDGTVSVVVAVDKLSILVTIAFSFIVFKEKLSPKAFIGLIIMILGTTLMIIDNFIII